MGSICQLKLKLEEIIDKHRQGSCSVLTVILPRKQFCAVVTESKVTFGKLYMLFFISLIAMNPLYKRWCVLAFETDCYEIKRKKTFFFFCLRVWVEVKNETVQDMLQQRTWSWSCLRPSRGLGKWKLPGRLFRRGGGNGPPTPASPFGGNGGLTAEGVAGVDAAAFGTSTGCDEEKKKNTCCGYKFYGQRAV